jgi:hypothetical protein
MPLNLDNLNDAEQFQKHFVNPVVDAVRAEIKSLVDSDKAQSARLDKLEGTQKKAMIGFAVYATMLSTVVGLGLAWLKSKAGKWIGLSVLMLSVMFITGCATVPHTTTAPVFTDPVAVQQIKHPIQSMALALGEIDNLMSLVNVLSVATFGVGVILMVYLRTSLGPSLILGGLASLVLSIMVKSMLWFIPWVAAGVALAGIIAFAVDVKQRGFFNAVHDVESLVNPPAS